jgi:TolB-like protein
MRRWLWISMLPLTVGACRSAGSHYLHPNVDVAALHRVAVLPFENLTTERTSAEKVQKIFTSELLALEAFEVVEPGAVVKALRAEHVDSVAGLGPPELKRLGDALKADAFFMGSVVDFAESHGNTPAPQVTIEMHLVEAQSGVTVWSTNNTRSGASVSARLFGVGGESLTDAARKLVRDQLHTLAR